MARIIPAIPPDPFGGRYVWIGAERRVRSSVNSFRFELQEGGHQPGFHYQAPETNKERMLR